MTLKPTLKKVLYYNRVDNIINEVNNKIILKAKFKKVRWK